MTIKTSNINELFFKLGNNNISLKNQGFSDGSKWLLPELNAIRETALAYGIEDIKLKDKVAFWLPKKLIYQENKD